MFSATAATCSSEHERRRDNQPVDSLIDWYGPLGGIWTTNYPPADGAALADASLSHEVFTTKPDQLGHATSGVEEDERTHLQDGSADQGSNWLLHDRGLLELESSPMRLETESENPQRMQSLAPWGDFTPPDQESGEPFNLPELSALPDISPSLLEPAFHHTDFSNHPDPVSFQRQSIAHAGLPRRKSVYSIAPSSAGRPMMIPAPNTHSQGLDPMQRWRESPPETEAASFSAIFDALRRMPVRRGRRSTRGRRTESCSSVGSATSQSSTSQSLRSVASSRSSGSINKPMTLRSSPRKVFRGRQSGSRSKDSRIFSCTFCCDSFTKKHDWMRHEKSLHLNLEQWVCAPFGGAVVSPMTGRNHCAYCNMLDPTIYHLEEHNHSACHTGQKARIFQRKDHLVQHLRGLHQLNTLPILDNWRLQPPVVISRCGICNAVLQSWKSRADHLTQHFRQGKTMADWEGDHGFEPLIAAQVRNAIPPYLLAVESQTPVPFFATDPRMSDHMSQISLAQQESYEAAGLGMDGQESHNGPGFELSPNTYTKYLAWHLGRFAQQSIANGVCPTDSMFQDEGRRILYGDEDGWEQTIADNSEWLASIRSEHLSI